MHVHSTVRVHADIASAITNAAIERGRIFDSVVSPQRSRLPQDPLGEDLMSVQVLAANMGSRRVFAVNIFPIHRENSIFCAGSKACRDRTPFTTDRRNR